MTAAAGVGKLRVGRSGDRTVVLSARAHSPLRLLTTRGEGGAAWTFSTTLGGGLVDGDALDLDITVERDARLVLTTQASTKIYRSPRGTRSELSARVDRGALLAVIPDAVVCFEGARYTQRTTIDLAEDASAAIVDLLHAGRVARGERWAMASYRSELIVRRAGALLMREALLLDPAQGSLRERFGRFDALATVVLTGPLLDSARARMVAEIEATGVRRDATLVEACSVRDELMLVRLAAHDSSTALSRLRTLLTELTPLVGDVLARKR